MIANKWYCIAQTSTFDTRCSINVAFDGHDIQFSASVKYGASSINITRCIIPDGISFSIRLRESGSQWFVDITSNTKITPVVTVADSEYWSSVNKPAAEGNIILLLTDITSKYNTSSFGGDSLFELVNVGTSDVPRYAVVPKVFQGQNPGVISRTFMTFGGLGADSNGEDDPSGVSYLRNLLDVRLSEFLEDSDVLTYDKNQDLWVNKKGSFNEEKLEEYLEKYKYITEDDIKGLLVLLQWFEFDDANHAVRVKSDFNFVVPNALSFGGLGSYSGGGEGGVSYLKNLLDVQLGTLLEDGEVLVYDRHLDRWVNKSIETGLDVNELQKYLTDNQYITLPSIKGLQDQVALNKSDIALLLSWFEYDEENHAVRVKSDFNFIVPKALSFGGAGVDNGAEITGVSYLKDLLDVQLGNVLGDGEVLVYDRHTGHWVNKVIETGLDIDSLQKYLTDNKYVTSAAVEGLQGQINNNATNIALLLSWLEYDEVNKALRVKNGYNFIVDGALSFGGLGEDDNPTPGGLTQVTIQLGNNPSDSYVSENGKVILPAYPIIPTLLSAFENDKGYLVVSDLNGYAKLTDIPSVEGFALTEDLNALSKQIEGYDNKFADVGESILDIEEDISKLAPLDDLEKLEEAVNPLFGYFDATGSANNALKLGGQLPSYYATKSALDTTNGNVVSLTQKMGTAESGISTNKTNIATLTTNLSNLTSRVSTAEGTIKEHTDAITLNANNIASNAKSITTNATAITAVSNRVKTFEDVIGIDANGDVYIKGTRNFYTAGGTIGMAGLGSGGTGGGGTAGLGSVTVRVNGQDYITDASGIVTIPNYPSLAGYATESWVGNNYLGLGGGTITHQNYGAFELKRNYVNYDSVIKYSNVDDGLLGYIGIGGSATANAPKAPYYSPNGDTVYALLHSGNYSSYALPLSGGTITGSSGNIFSVNRTDGNPVVRFDYNGEILGRMGYDTSGNAIAQYGGSYYTLIHTGNYADTTDKRYLQLSGGTINSNSVETGLQFQTRDSATLAGIVRNSNSAYGFYLWNSNGGRLGLREDGTPHYNNNTLYHTGNFSPADYLPLSGGTIEGGYGALSIKRNSAYASLLKFENTDGVMGYLGFSNTNIPAWYTSDVATSYTLIHSGNYSSYALPLTGGTISGQTQINHNLIIGPVSGLETYSYGLYFSSKTSPTLWGIRMEGDVLKINGNDFVHSGNIGSQSVDKANRLVSQYVSNLDSAEDNRFFSSGFQATNRPWENYVTGLSLYNTELKYKYQLGFSTSGGIFARYKNSTTWQDWRELAYKDSNVASAQALVHSNGTVGATVDANGKVRVNEIDLLGSDGSSVIAYLCKASASDNTIRFFGKDANSMVFGTNNLERMRINGSGNVTIGSSDLASTTTKLYVDGGIRFSPRTIWGNSFDGTANLDGNITSIRKDFRFYYDTNKLFLQAASTALIIGEGTIDIATYINGKELNFLTGNSTRFKVTSGGNILIGTTDDNGYKLDVYGKTRITDVLYLNANIIGNGYKLYYGTTNPRLELTDGTTTMYAQLYNSQMGIGPGSGKGIYITSGGNVLVNTNVDNSSGAKLQVAGNLTITGDITSEGTMAMARLSSSSDARLKDNISTLSAEQSISTIRQLRPTSWNWKADGTLSYGLIAQEVEQVAGCMVTRLDDAELGQKLYLQYNQLHAFEIGAIQHIDSEVDKLKKDLAIANGRIEVLENELKQYRRNA